MGGKWGERWGKVGEMGGGNGWKGGGNGGGGAWGKWLEMEDVGEVNGSPGYMCVVAVGK